MNRNPAGTIALVTGASRGAGRAIAIELGVRGATVFVTGRSTASGSRTEDLPGTIDETAALVTGAGGRGIAVRCDHTSASEVLTLFEAVRQHGGLDLLVNNVWGGYEGYDGRTFDDPFWEQPLDARWQGMWVAGVRAHLMASQHAARLMIPRRSGLIVSTVAWAFGEYMGSVFYDAAKAAIARAIHGMAVDLRPHGVATAAVAPGFMRTERVLAAQAAAGFDFPGTESPHYLGRAIAALAGDPEVMRWSGQLLTAGALAREYGFTDQDGSQPAPFRMRASEVPAHAV